MTKEMFENYLKEILEDVQKKFTELVRTEYKNTHHIKEPMLSISMDSEGYYNAFSYDEDVKVVNILKCED